MNLNFNIIVFIVILLVSNVLSQDLQENVEPWKIDIQILLGFKDNQIDGAMGRDTFEALKIFAYKHDLTDVVLRGEYDDIGYRGFQQYLMKYNQYWIRELKNRKILDDVTNKEYIKQADETLYSFEIAIEKAQLEVERLTRAKSKSRREARERQESEDWMREKAEVERIITSLKSSIVTAEVQAEKWSLERLRAERLAQEQEQFARLDERKREASMLTTDLEDVIRVAKREIDHLIEENKKLKKLVIDAAETKKIAEDTRSLANQIKSDLIDTRIDLDSIYSRQIAEDLKLELEQTKFHIDSLSNQKNNLENKLSEITEKITQESELLSKKKWYKRLWPFGTKDDKNVIKEPKDQEKSKKDNKWYKRLWPFGKE